MVGMKDTSLGFDTGFVLHGWDEGQLTGFRCEICPSWPE